MRHVLAIDQGTTGSTCLIIRSDGAIVGRGYREIQQFYPGPGLVEHDAEGILRSTCEAARDAIKDSGVSPEAVGITNQRETVVLWDRESGEPVNRAIVWQDRRTAARCNELAAHADMILNTTGLVLDPYFSATKIEWLLAQPNIAPLAESGRLVAGTIDSWLIWKLTGGAVHATDYTNASRTMLFDIHERRWSDDLLTLFGVPQSILPEVRKSASYFGDVLPEFFGVAAPILGVAGDQQAALMGQGCWSAGEGKNTYGTGAFLLLNTGDKRPSTGDGLLTTLACTDSGEVCYALEASIFIAGAAIQWLRDGLELIESADECDSLARSLSSNDGVYFVPALTGLGAPHWEANARGLIAGLTRGTTRAHLVRAALESMAYGTADVIGAMSRHGGVSFDVLRVDGGAASNDWMMQYQADVLGITVERPEQLETTALGAAALAGITAGIWKDGAHFLGSRDFTAFAPSRDRDDMGAVKQAIEGWHRAVKATLYHARL